MPLITGLRGVSKVVLLNEFDAMCTDAGWYADAKEVGPTTPLITLVRRTKGFVRIEQANPVAPSPRSGTLTVARPPPDA